MPLHPYGEETKHRRDICIGDKLVSPDGGSARTVTDVDDEAEELYGVTLINSLYPYEKSEFVMSSSQVLEFNSDLPMKFFDETRNRFLVAMLNQDGQLIRKEYPLRRLVHVLHIEKCKKDKKVVFDLDDFVCLPPEVQQHLYLRDAFGIRHYVDLVPIGFGTHKVIKVNHDGRYIGPNDCIFQD